jgi:hypothetical protein
VAAPVSLERRTPVFSVSCLHKLLTAIVEDRFSDTQASELHRQN